MWMSDSHRDAHDLNHGILVGGLLAAALGLFLYNSQYRAESVFRDDGISVVESGSAGADSAAVSVSPGVGFAAIQSGEPLIGEFGEVSIDLLMNEENPGRSTLSATVATATVSTGDSQIDGTIVSADWFASDEYPDATFNSSNFEAMENSAYRVYGEITIRGVARPLEFVISLEDGVGRGEFVIDRRDFGIGDDGQDEFVDPQVTINFRVPYSKTQ